MTGGYHRDFNLPLVVQGGKMKISISFCANDFFVQHLAVAIASFAKNNPSSELIFHVLHHDIAAQHQDMLSEWGRRNNREISFHKVDATPFRTFPTPTATVTREMYYRYLLPSVLTDEERTIYFDVDVVCVGDIRPLWTTNLGENILGAVIDSPSSSDKKKRLGLTGTSPYFNSGMLVMDLARMRRENAPDSLLENTARYANCVAWPDQDVINITFHNRIQTLSTIWNNRDSYSPFDRHTIIWHFAGITSKPWCYIWKNRTWPIYLKYLLRTPFRNKAGHFIWQHVKGFFWFEYTKKKVTRTLCCGLLVRKRTSV